MQSRARENFPIHREKRTIRQKTLKILEIPLEGYGPNELPDVPGLEEVPPLPTIKPPKTRLMHRRPSSALDPVTPSSPWPVNTHQSTPTSSSGNQ